MPKGKGVELRSKLVFQALDQNMCRFKVDNTAKFRSNVIMTFDRDVIPADFDPITQNVRASVVINFEVEKK